jgi:hypothetical protein
MIGKKFPARSFECIVEAENMTSVDPALGDVADGGGVADSKSERGVPRSSKAAISVVSEPTELGDLGLLKALLERIFDEVTSPSPKGSTAVTKSERPEEVCVI